MSSTGSPSFERRTDNAVWQITMLNNTRIAVRRELMKERWMMPNPHEIGGHREIAERLAPACHMSVEPVAATLQFGVDAGLIASTPVSSTARP